MEQFEPIFIIAVMGFSVDAIVETIKQIMKGKSINHNVIIALVVGQILAFTFRLDVYASFGIVSYIPYVTTVVTGLMISRGGSFIYDLWDKFTDGMGEPKE